MSNFVHRFGGRKVISTFLGMLLLAGGVGAGVILMIQPQLLEQKAASVSYACEDKSDQGCMANSTYCTSPNCIPGSGKCLDPNNTFCAKFVNNTTGLSFCTHGDEAQSTTKGAVHCVVAGSNRKRYQCPPDKPFYQPTTNTCGINPPVKPLNESRRWKFW